MARTVSIFLLLIGLFSPFASWAEESWPQKEAMKWVIKATPENAATQYPQKLAQLYYANSYRPFWRDYRSRRIFESQLKELALSDIADNFSIRYYDLLEAKLSRNWRHYDLLATDTLLAYISYVDQAPKFGKSWFFGGDVSNFLPEPSELMLQSFIEAVDSNTLYQYLQALSPQSDQYAYMTDSLAHLLQLQKQGWPVYYQARMAKKNSILSDKATLVTILERLDALTPEQALNIRLEDNDSYSTELQLGVKRFQEIHGLKPDGIIGKNTLYWLQLGLEERVRIMALNIQRLRIWPESKQSTILVNIPDYKLEFWLEDELVLDSRVVVGRPSRKTPLFDARLDSVVFNPSWNVPIKIMRKDILPKLKSDSEYLARHNYSVLRSWSNREVIPLDAIDWSQVTPNNFTYRLQQRPGNGNALGRYKFNTPNRNAIYLHDTPSKSLFNKESRAYSSGCIRVEQASVLADVLMKNSNINLSRVEKYRSNVKTRSVSLKNRIQVYTIYQTAWVDDDGQVNFRKDVYNYDKMRKSSKSRKKLMSAYVH